MLPTGRTDVPSYSSLNKDGGWFVVLCDDMQISAAVCLCFDHLLLFYFSYGFDGLGCEAVHG